MIFLLLLLLQKVPPIALRSRRVALSFGSTISGLVFGAVIIAGRRSIWPAAIAHGANHTFGILELYNG
jgi:hypothetical protein